ncbi:MAG: multiheme c-type cytochrome, partial [Acidobacteriota bacterium]
MFRTFAFVAALFAALLGVLVGWGREARRETAIGLGPDRAGGRTERCVTCHTKETEDPGGAHARAALGCASCHLGNALAFEKERAHEGLEREPGALSTVALTCGRADCHAREAARVATSPMTRNAGMIAVDRFAFGEIASPDGRETIADVFAATHPTPAQDHLRKLCAGCHLGTRRANRDDQIGGNGSGCAACHVARNVDEKPRRHPAVDSKVTDDRCEGCHSGSGRIALSYRGLVEVEKGEPFAHAAPDVHQAAGMACIDCHLHTDLMGDGTARTHKEEQVEITCEACHGPVREGGEVAWRDVKDEISREILAREERRERDEDKDPLRKGKRGGGRPPDAATRLGTRGVPLLNLLRKSSSLSSSSSSSTPTSSSSSWVLVRKLDGVELPVKQTPRDRNHALRGHERLTCSSCHAAWV